MRLLFWNMRKSNKESGATLISGQSDKDRGHELQKENLACR